MRFRRQQKLKLRLSEDPVAAQAVKDWAAARGFKLEVVGFYPARPPEQDPTVEKQCSLCRRVKPLDDFTPRRDRPCGRQPWCKACMCEYQRARRAA